MHGPSDFAALLALLAALPGSPLTEAERAEAVAVAREHFLARAHDPRLVAIVERITAPAPAPEPEPAKPARGRRA